MRRYIGGLLMLYTLLVLPSRSLAQHPLDEGQQKQIGITNVQQKQMEEVFAKAGPRRRAILDRRRDLYIELHKLDSNYEFDQKKATTLIQQIVELQRQLLALHAYNEGKIRQILNADQFQRLRALLDAEHAKHQHDRPRPDWNWGGDHGPRPPGDHGDTPVPQTTGQHKL